MNYHTVVATIGDNKELPPHLALYTTQKDYNDLIFINCLHNCTDEEGIFRNPLKLHLFMTEKVPTFFSKFRPFKYDEKEGLKAKVMQIPIKEQHWEWMGIYDEKIIEGKKYWFFYFKEKQKYWKKIFDSMFHLSQKKKKYYID